MMAASRQSFGSGAAFDPFVLSDSDEEAQLPSSSARGSLKKRAPLIVGDESISDDDLARALARHSAKSATPVKQKVTPVKTEGRKLLSSQGSGHVNGKTTAKRYIQQPQPKAGPSRLRGEPEEQSDSTSDDSEAPRPQAKSSRVKLAVDRNGKLRTSAIEGASPSERALDKGKAAAQSAKYRVRKDAQEEAKLGSWANPAPLVIRRRAPSKTPPEPEHEPGTWENPEPLVIRKRKPEVILPGASRKRGKSYARKSVGGRAPRPADTNSGADIDSGADHEEADVEDTLGLVFGQGSASPRRASTPSQKGAASPGKEKSPQREHVTPPQVATPPRKAVAAPQTAATRPQRETTPQQTMAASSQKKVLTLTPSRTRIGPSWATDNTAALGPSQPERTLVPSGQVNSKAALAKGAAAISSASGAPAPVLKVVEPPADVPQKPGPAANGPLGNVPETPAANANRESTAAGRPKDHRQPTPPKSAAPPEKGRQSKSRSTSLFSEPHVVVAQVKQVALKSATPLGQQEDVGLSRASPAIVPLPTSEVLPEPPATNQSTRSPSLDQSLPALDLPAIDSPGAAAHSSAASVVSNGSKRDERSQDKENGAGSRRKQYADPDEDDTDTAARATEATQTSALTTPPPTTDDVVMIDLTTDSDREESVVPVDINGLRDTSAPTKLVNKLLDNAKTPGKRSSRVPSPRAQTPSNLGFDNDPSTSLFEDDDLLPGIEVKADGDADLRLSRAEWQDALDVISTEVDLDRFTGRDMVSKEELNIPADRLAHVRRHLDTTFVDKLHSFTKTSNKPELQCAIFEAYIEMCTANDEPSAPEIKIRNETRTGLPPAFEFEYSNDMLYTPAVPDPEESIGCSCEGPCDPNSKTCMCVARQELYLYGIQTGFAYNKDGTVKQFDCPIWECGPHCGCPPECMNRVIQRGRSKDVKLEIFKTRKKGWGVRTKSFIPQGRFIGVYSGELITEAETEARGRLYDRIGRTYLFDLDGYHIANPPEGLEFIDPRAYELAQAAKDRAENARLKDGSDEFCYSAYSVDAFHFGFTRYFNHSCDPNLVTVQAYVKDFHPERPLLIIVARRNIMPGEEMCISYKGVPDPLEPAALLDPQRTPMKTAKQTKKTATVHSPGVLTRTSEQECFCGAYNCNGSMFSNQAM